MINLYRDRPDLYDLLHDGVIGDTSFYAGIAAAMAPPSGAILELGCGTGRVMATLLDQGWKVTGLDAEPAMLARARPRLARFGARARLIQGDMCRPGLGEERFDLVIVAVNTFMHLRDHAAQRACLAAIHDHLTDDGAAILDLANPFHMLTMPQGVVTLRHRETDTESDQDVTVTGVLEVDPTAPGLVDYLFFDETSPDGTPRRLSTQVEMRLVFMPELELLLAGCGLGIADAYGDYDLGPYYATSERMIAVIRGL